MRLGDKLRSAVSGLPKAYWVLWTGVLINQFGTFVMPFLSIYLTQKRHLSVATAGLILSMYGAGGALAGVIGGVLADRLGRRPTMLFALGFGGAGTVALGYLSSPWSIAAMTFGVGLITNCFRPAMQATVVDVVRPDDRARAFGNIYWAVNLGFSAGLVVAGMVVKHSYLALFLGDGATSIVFALLVFAAVPESRPAPGPKQEAGAPSGLWHALRDLDLLAFTGLSFLFGALLFQSASTLPIELVRHAVTPQLYGLLIAFNCILVVILQPLAAPLTKRFPRARVLALATLLMGLGFGSNAFFSTLPLYVVGVAVWTLGEVGFAPIAPSVVADLSPDHLRGRYQGVSNSAWGLSAFAGPALGAWVMSTAGSRALWLGCIGVGVVAAAGQLAIAPRRRRRLAAAGRGEVEHGVAPRAPVTP